MADIAKRYASNPGSQNGVDGMVAGIPLAMAFGQMLTDNVADKFAGGSLFGSGQNFGNNNKSNNANESSANKSFCTECGSEVSSEDVFCSSCGTKLNQGLKCSECGKTLEPEDKFCSSCGTKVEK